MTQQKKERIADTRNKRKSVKRGRRDELLTIVKQLLFTTLVISGIALVAAAMGIESRDFWEVIRGAIGLQGILQGSRILAAWNK